MSNMQKLLQTKEKIIDFIKQKGPELPVRIANSIGVSNLFTAAFMSELVSEQKLKISSMRIGSSPLYYITGQEEQLQKYTDYLNHKEKEAFNLLKQNTILQDSEQEPAIRVALRSIKDFAVPIQIKDKEEIKIFWKIHTLSNEEAKQKIEQILNPIKQKPAVPQEKEIAPIKEIKQEESKKAEKKVEATLDIFAAPKEKPAKKDKTPKPITSEFLTNIKSILEEKNFEILVELLVKKKEYSAKVRTDTHLGKQEFYLTAKDKKKITTEDIVSALQKSQAEKMPALILSPGEIDKKAQDYYKEWRNLIKHEKIRI